MIRIIRLFFIFCLICGLTGGYAAAEDISVQAQVDKVNLDLGDSVQFGITISGTQKVSPIKLPPLDGFNIQYIGPSRSVSIVNGSYSSSVTFNYSLLPTKEGQLTIPPLQITIAGKAYKTEPIVIHVGKTSAGAGKETAADTLNDKIFLKMTVPKTDVYINEPIPLKIYLYSTGVQIGDIQYPTLDTVGFTEEKYGQPRQVQQNIQGRIFNIVEFKKTIYPTRTGELTLGPAAVASNLIIQKQVSRANRVFDDPFFNSFFGRQEKRALTIKSNKITLNVRPLPEAGKPANFSGAVGQYDFTVELGPSTKVHVGDPLTLHMQIKGEGNLQATKFPTVADTKNFKLYDPDITEKGGKKQFEQVLIPTSDKVKELGPLSFSYFDPQTKKYQTITRGPFALTVEPAPENEEPLTVVGLNQPGRRTVLQPETIGQDILFIKDEPGKVMPIGNRIYHHWLYWLLVILTTILFLSSYIFYKRTYRLQTDSRYARAQKAPRAARSGLAQAQEFLKEENQAAFYDAVFKTLQSYLSDKLSLPAGSITAETVRKTIDGKKHSEELSQSLDILFQECETVRYASATVPPEKMHEVFLRLEATIQLMERVLS